MIKKITEFQGEYRWLSNFVGLLSPSKLTVEHHYQAAKCKYPEDQDSILNAETPGKAKRAARKVVMREDWNDIRIAVMYRLVERKFLHNPSLGEKLIATGDALLIEGNRWHDNFWGNCVCPKCENKPGQNWLGCILMLVRSQLIHKLSH